jgi:hypothetical protein
VSWADRLPGIEVPPLSLRLRDPVWGIDPSTKRAAITTLDPTGADGPPRMRVASAEFPELDMGARRMTAATIAVRDLALVLLEGAAPPALVYVEQPFGGGGKGSKLIRPNPQQYFNVAAIQIGLGLALPRSTRIDLVGPPTWKSTAMGAGQGFAKKGAILRWARSVGYDRTCPVCHAQVDLCDAKNVQHDEADSVGIATAAGVVRFGEEDRNRKLDDPLPF